MLPSLKRRFELLSPTFMRERRLWASFIVFCGGTPCIQRSIHLLGVLGTELFCMCVYGIVVLSSSLFSPKEKPRSFGTHYSDLGDGVSFDMETYLIIAL